MFKYKDLDSIAKSKVLSESDIIKIGMDVCNALEACERKGIMHRDIKPGNIFMPRIRIRVSICLLILAFRGL
ncbi:MAG: protein kinase domain-containing protein [Streptococcus sp.]